MKKKDKSLWKINLSMTNSILFGLDDIAMRV